MKPPFLLLLFLFCVKFNAQVSQRLIDSLKQNISVLPDDSNKVNSLNTLAFAVKYTDEPLVEKCLTEAIQIAEKINYYKGLGASYKTKGIIYDEHGHYSDAVNSYVKALNYYGKVNDKMGTARAEANIGIVLRKLKKDKEAIEYFRKSFCYIKGKNAYFEMLLNMNIGIAYINLKNDDSTLHYELLAVKIMSENKLREPNAYGNLGLAYIMKKDYKKAEELIKKCLEMKREDHEYPSAVAVWCQNLADVYNDTNRPEEARKLLLEAAELFGEDRYNNEALHTYYSLFHFYGSRNDAKNIFKYAKMLAVIKDSIFNLQSTKQINELKEKYETDKKESEIKLLTADKALQDEALKKNKIFIIAGTILLVLILFFSLFVIRSNRQKQKINSELVSKNQLIETQKGIVEEKQKEILDSIEYAKRLQQAILPPEKMITAHFADSFIYYVPKDIVAGDFYWAEYIQQKELLLVAAADCTGHGVPGALMSMVCSNALHRAVQELGIIHPGEILDKVRELVIESFEKSESDVKDGMDISLASIHIPSGKIEWSGANNALWYIKNGSMFEIKASKQPIGKTENPKPFEQHSLHLSKGDSIYLFTDGFADQFGGPKGKKYKHKQLQELLSLNSHKFAAEQKENLHTAFTLWKGKLEQVDDVCVIGIKL